MGGITQSPMQVLLQNTNSRGYMDTSFSAHGISGLSNMKHF